MKCKECNIQIAEDAVAVFAAEMLWPTNLALQV